MLVKKFWIEVSEEGKFYVTDGINESEDFDTLEEAEGKLELVLWGEEL